MLCLLALFHCVSLYVYVKANEKERKQASMGIDECLMALCLCEIERERE